MKVAIIDFDGTLFPKDTIPFMMDFWIKDGQNKWRYRKIMALIYPYYLLYKLSMGNKAIKEKFRTYSFKTFNRLFDGFSEQEIYAFFHRAGLAIRKELRPSMVQEIKRLQADGYKTVLLSGAYRELLKASVYDLNFYSILGSTLKFDKDGIFDAINGLTMIEGRHKVSIVGDHFSLSENDWLDAYAYGDSITDAQLLSKVGHPVMVAPDPLLIEMGLRMQWKNLPS